MYCTDPVKIHSQTHLVELSGRPANRHLLQGKDNSTVYLTFNISLLYLDTSNAAVGEKHIHLIV